jgi:hypothetical protein
MKTVPKLLRNLLLLGVIVIGLFLLVAIFYPSTLPILSSVSSVFGKLKLWPFIIVMVVLSALVPSRRKR